MRVALLILFVDKKIYKFIPIVMFESGYMTLLFISLSLASSDCPWLGSWSNTEQEDHTWT
jgi:hypothetical protein